MTLPTVLQMIWGAPNIRARFTENSTNGLRLECVIENRPLQIQTRRLHRLMSHVGVRRMPAEDVWAQLSICSFSETQRELDSNDLFRKEIISEQPFITMPTGGRAQRITLPASILGASFVVAEQTGGKVTVTQKNDGEFVKIPNGLYVADIVIWVDSHRTSYSPRFVVQDRPPYLYWINS